MDKGYTILHYAGGTMRAPAAAILLCLTSYIGQNQGHKVQNADL